MDYADYFAWSCMLSILFLCAVFFLDNRRKGPDRYIIRQEPVWLTDEETREMRDVSINHLLNAACDVEYGTWFLEFTFEPEAQPVLDTLVFSEHPGYKFSVKRGRVMIDYQDELWGEEDLTPEQRAELVFDYFEDCELEGTYLAQLDLTVLLTKHPNPVPWLEHPYY